MPIRRVRRSRPIKGRLRKHRRAKPRRNPRLVLPAMPLYHIHNREAVRIRPYDSRGRLRSRALRRFARFLRCHHTDRVRPIRWRLLVVLYDLWLRFGQPQVTVFSGHRPRVVARLKTSRHIIGAAIDFNFNGVSNARVRDVLLKRYANVGVGYYPNSYHVHLDVRSRRSFWIDYSGAGEDAQYARNPHADLRRGLVRRGNRPGHQGGASGRGKPGIRGKGRRR